uniref:hypothetical protein n=1 Tax=Pseudomonas aeruginosa TaxID=287 RepID=UPI0039C16BA7
MPKPQKRPVKRTAPPEAPNEDLIDAGEVISSARSLLTKLRLSLPRRPKDAKGNVLDPHFPNDLSKLTLHELSRLHGQFHAMADY